MSISICCCSLAGTAACQHCPQNPFATEVWANKTVTTDHAESSVFESMKRGLEQAINGETRSETLTKDGDGIKDLNFYWRLGDYALEAAPIHLARFDPDEPNVTIDLVKYYPYKGRECKYSIGYFWYDEKEPCWELKFVGDRFKEILETDVTAVFHMLKAAYDTLEEWSRKEKDDA